MANICKEYFFRCTDLDGDVTYLISTSMYDLLESHRNLLARFVSIVRVAEAKPEHLIAINEFISRLS